LHTFAKNLSYKAVFIPFDTNPSFFRKEKPQKINTLKSQPIQ
jgi:hypothetical protein